VKERKKAYYGVGS